MTDPVRLVDLWPQHDPLLADIQQAIAAVARRSAFAGGEEVAALEAELARRCGTAHAVATSSGTAALLLALRALDLAPGDEIATVPNSDPSTTAAIVHAGAAVRLVDIEAGTFVMSPAALERAITPRTRAVVPVHLYGYPAPMEAILEVAARHHLFVIGDAALALGAVSAGRLVTAVGDAACLSFAPRKILGGWGNGGMVVTRSAELAARIRTLRAYGEAAPGGTDAHRSVIACGYNLRLDTLQAAVLLQKLPRLGAWIERRREIGARYRRLFAGTPVRVPAVPAGSEPVYRYFAVRLPGRQRDAVRHRLAEQAIETAIHYVPPQHLQPAYQYLACLRGSFPETERAAEEVLLLPLYPEMPDADIDRVARSVLEALAVEMEVRA